MDGLYALERRMWEDYKGMRLGAVLDQAVITHENDEGVEEVVFDALMRDMVCLRLEGPSLDDGRRVAVILPVASEMLKYEDIWGHLADNAAEAMLCDVGDNI